MNAPDSYAHVLTGRIKIMSRFTSPMASYGLCYSVTGFACLMAAMTPACANGDLVTHVKTIGNEAGVIYIMADTTGIPGAASCAGGTPWAFSIPSDNAAMLAMLLAAQMSGKKVHLSGAGTCKNRSSIEDLYALQLLSD